LNLVDLLVIYTKISAVLC